MLGAPEVEPHHPQQQGITRGPLLLESLLPVSDCHFRDFPARCLVRMPCQVGILAPNLHSQVSPGSSAKPEDFFHTSQRVLRVGNARPGCDHPNLEIIAPKSQQMDRANFGARSRSTRQGWNVL